jgi:hypothetical protein
VGRRRLTQKLACHHTQVVKDLKRRDDHEKIQDREMVQRSLEHGGKLTIPSTWKSLGNSSNNGITRPFQTTRKREEVDIQLVRSVVSVGIPMRFSDNPEVRKTVLMTTECG